MGGMRRRASSLSVCPDERGASQSASCIQATGDVIRPATATYFNSGVARGGEIRIYGDYRTACNSADGEDRSEDDSFSLRLGSASLVTSTRTFTINGESPDFLSKLQPEGEAALARWERVHTRTYNGLVSDVRNWLAKSGSITCATEADFLACRFTDVPFEGDGKTSVASGWIHTYVQTPD
jgi:hypothetical protein